jgi:hypothetical protein
MIEFVMPDFFESFHAVRMVHRGQRRQRKARNGQVVEADHRDIVRHLQSAPVQAQAGTEGHLVVGREDGAEGPTAVEQATDCGQATFLLKRAGYHERRFVAEACCLDRRAIAPQPLVGIGVGWVAGDEGDLPVPQGQQMVGREPGAFEVVEVQRRELGTCELAAGDDHRHRLGDVAQRRVAEPTGQHDDAVDPTRAQGLDAASLFRRIPLATDEQRAVTRPVEFILDAAQRHAVEGAVDRLGDDADAQGAPTGQAAGHRVGHEAELCDRLVDRLLLLATDHRRAIQDARDRARRYTGQAGHHVERHDARGSRCSRS